MNDPEKPQVQAIHRVMKHAVLSNNRIIPVTNWYGRDGEECDPYAAVTCVAGADDVGWYAIDLLQFVPVKVH